LSSERIIYGFHAIIARMRQRASSVREIYLDRSDKRAEELRKFAAERNVRVVSADKARLDALAGHLNHQGVAARVEAVALAHDLDELLEALQEPPLVLLLDSVQDPHNLGACLRVADAAGAHAVIAPKDRAVGLTAAAIKVASGAADSVPYLTVTNLARTMRELKEREIWLIGAAEDAPQSLFAGRLTGALGLVLGAEGSGLRRLTREHCDELVAIPMFGAVASLNVSVATGICLYEARRQREMATATANKPMQGQNDAPR
jgi:23S rRNA (guanosine2251-2'-O)-methyltransferase